MIQPPVVIIHEVDAAKIDEAETLVDIEDKKIGRGRKHTERWSEFRGLDESRGDETILETTHKEIIEKEKTGRMTKSEPQSYRKRKGPKGRPRRYGLGKKKKAVREQKNTHIHTSDTRKP